MGSSIIGTLLSTILVFRHTLLFMQPVEKHILINFNKKTTQSDDLHDSDDEDKRRRGAYNGNSTQQQ